MSVNSGMRELWVAEFRPGEAIRLKLDYAEAFNNRGNARSDKGNLNGAMQDYSEAIRLKPDYAAAFNNRGVARHDKGDMEGAAGDFKEAKRLRSAGQA